MYLDNFVKGTDFGFLFLTLCGYSVYINLNSFWGLCIQINLLVVMVRVIY